MTDEHKRAVDLFLKIIDLPPAEQTAELDRECAGNLELRQEVAELLVSCRQADDGGFLQRRALEDAAAQIHFPLAPSNPPIGTVLGRYRLVRPIGAGGMGVVYEAEDLTLPRRVAVKVLPPGSLDLGRKERIQRFEREARTASQLNHPHIVSILDAAFDQGFYYIAMEFVEGRTLRTLIQQEARSVEARMVLDLIAQSASALSAAHQAGIVHRDIKPENIMVRPDGFVKVLDFGLASVRETSSDPADLRTRPGHMAGTIQYLSPEQVMGRAATPRSDLFSLGVVAYEVATGVRPFDGPTDGLIFEAILNHIPLLPSAQRQGLGVELDAMILRLLEKDSELRFQTAQDLQSVCKRLSRDSSSPHLPAKVVRRPRRRQILLGTASLGALAGAGIMWLLSPGKPRPGSELPSHFEQLTNSNGEDTFPGLSADGRQFIYASPRTGNWDIYLQRTGGRAYVNLTKDSQQDDTEPALSPDGSHIAFRSEREGGGLFVMETTGENPHRVAAHGFLPAWSPDGRRLVYSTHTFITPRRAPPPPSMLRIINLDNDSEQQVKTGDALQPAWSPHGFRIAYWGISSGGQRDIFTISATADRAPVAVTSDTALDWNPVWAPSGKLLYFLSDRGGSPNIWRVAIDERSGTTLGTPEPVTVPAENVRALGIAADGKSLIYSQASQKTTLWRIGFDPLRRIALGTPEPIGERQTITNFCFSPDGNQVVYDTIGDTSENLWIMNVDGSARRSLTFDSFRNRAPQWSPQGDWILFYSDRSGHYDEWLIQPDGSGLHALTNGAKLDMQNAVWSPDGKRILAGRFAPTLELDAGATKPAATPQDAAAIHSISGLFCSSWTEGPDGSLAACDLVHSPGHYQAAVYSPVTRKLEQPGLRGTSTIWAPSNGFADAHRALLFADGSRCMLYDRRTGKASAIFSVAPNAIANIASAPQHTGIYFSQDIRQSDLWRALLGK